MAIALDCALPFHYVNRLNLPPDLANMLTEQHFATYAKEYGKFNTGLAVKGSDFFGYLDGVKCPNCAELKVVTPQAKKCYRTKRLDLLGALQVQLRCGDENISIYGKTVRVEAVEPFIHFFEPDLKICVKSDGLVFKDNKSFLFVEAIDELAYSPKLYGHENKQLFEFVKKLASTIKAIGGIIEAKDGVLRFYGVKEIFEGAIKTPIEDGSYMASAEVLFYLDNKTGQIPDDFGRFLAKKSSLKSKRKLKLNDLNTPVDLQNEVNWIALPVSWVKDFEFNATEVYKTLGNTIILKLKDHGKNQ